MRAVFGDQVFDIVIQKSIRFPEATVANQAMLDYAVKHQGACLLYTSDAADERSSVDLGGRRIIKKKNRTQFLIVLDSRNLLDPTRHEQHTLALLLCTHIYLAPGRPQRHKNV